MSDLTPEVLDELERRVMNSLPEPWAALPWGDGSSPNGHVNIVWQDEQGDGVVIMKDVLVDDAKATVDLRNHARDLIEAARERDRLRTILAKARAWIASETEGASGRYASSLVGDIDATLERKDGGQCSTQQS